MEQSASHLKKDLAAPSDVYIRQFLSINLSQDSASQLLHLGVS